MAEKANKCQGVPHAPDLSDAAQTIARGREIVEESRRLGSEADRQIEGVQATLEQADRVLDRSHELLSDKPDRSPR